MLRSSQHTIVVGDRILDLARETLRDSRGDIVSLRPRAWAVLRLLATRAGQMVSKNEIMAEVWSDCEVTEDSLVQAVGDIRRALGDAGRSALKTLPRRGYMLVVDEMPIDTLAVSCDTARPSELEELPPSSPMPHLSIVVLPFANIGGDSTQDYFADGVTESLTTDLSRLAGSFVIGRNTAFTFKGKAVDARRIGRDLNVRYVLEGSVQRGGNRFRLNAQLTDTETGSHVWAERFDKPAADLLDMQDEIVSRLANTLNAELIKAEARRAERSPRPDAMDLYFQGRACINKGVTPVFLAQARDFFARALALDPGNVEAAVAAAQIDVSVASAFLTDHPSVHFESAETALHKVLVHAPNHPRTHMLLGAVQMQTRRALSGIAECRQALLLDPNLADAHGFIGLGKFLLGRGEEVEEHIREALRLSPHDTRTYLWYMFVGLGKLSIGADGEAVDWFRRSIECNRNHALAHFHFATALALVGDLGEARAATLAGLAVDPSFTIRRYRTKARVNNTAHLRFYEGMRLAGVPET
ncbi:winged helix-turn-helix domain-containing protein [Bradyrhizobium sp. CCGB12]|uniref:winged helix-turn-helix domain-containing protein n=1 Tax=Bradyrhizobium sp. CCGB12 TaxID=2949632 RepID=UPI0020B3F3A8|nr:winged helix-turn-helix domain-containing protein [Bradyrhizobium sp. CCGB12]MCP3390853.1 winged helix-turn-helix domain-containing protein [Bradyrhizobium sp. CCGB12]